MALQAGTCMSLSYLLPTLASEAKVQSMHGCSEALVPSLAVGT